MRRLLVGLLVLASWAGRAAAAPTVLENAAANGRFAAAAPTHEAAADEAGAVFEGKRTAGPVVAAEGDAAHRPNLYAAPGVSQAAPTAPPSPQLPASGEAKKKWPAWMMYGAGGGLGFLQGALFGGLAAGLGGAAIGLAATHFYMEDKPEVSLGISAGSIVGSFLGGPVGGLIGAAVGGLVGWLVGKLF